jgi:cadmium resistance protein CadD (predicted permease)
MSAAGRTSPSRSDTAVRVGAVLVAMGTLASIATLVPLFSGLDPLPVGVYLLCFLAPLGLAVILVAIWQRARGRSERLRAAARDHSE